MHGLRVIAAVAAAWVILVLACRWLLLPRLRRGPGGDPVNGLLWYAMRAVTCVLHRPQDTGHAQVRERLDAGPLIVVSNHTGPIDPFLIQSACRFEIRWMMASDMMLDALAPLWNRQRVIPVARDGRDMASARQAIRHVRGGGVLGIFPEGRIVNPPRHVWPFLPGVGLIVARTGAPVLLVWVSGTPAPRDNLWASLFTPSQARVRFLETINYGKAAPAAQITADLRRRLHEASGWPCEDDPPARPLWFEERGC